VEIYNKQTFMIRAVIFDVDGVLVQSFEANFKFYQNLLVAAGYAAPSREIYTTMFHMTMEDVIRALIKSDDETEVQRIWTIGKDRRKWYPSELITTPPQYKEVIHQLSTHYSLAIVTSRIRGAVFSLPQLSDLENLFAVTVYFEDTVQHKPHPEPLLLACKRLAINPTEAVDMQAAHSAQMRSIAFSPTTLPGADATTDIFEQIPVLIQQL